MIDQAGLRTVPAPGFDSPEKMGKISLEKRNRLIRYLHDDCHWSKVQLRDFFDLTERQVRRVLNPKPESGSVHLAAHLSPREVLDMATDYLSDPYLTAEDREFAAHWIQLGCPVGPG